MSWILDHFGLLVFLFFVFMFVRKIRAVLKQAEDQANRRGSRPIGNVDPDEAERVRKIQEEIRRKIAERRGGGGEMRIPPPMAETIERPTTMRPQTPPTLDPFGGPMKRMLAELERRVQESTEPPPVPRETVREEAGDSLRRQRELAAQLRAAQEVRQATQTDEPAGAVEHVHATAVMKSLGSATNAARSELFADLRDPRGLRRAIVLREILGTPVGLR